METIIKIFDQQSRKNQKHIKFNGELALPRGGRDKAQYYLDFMFGSTFEKQTTAANLCSIYADIVAGAIYENQLGQAMLVSGLKSVSTKEYVDDYIMFMQANDNGLSAVLIEKDATPHQCSLKVAAANGAVLKYIGKLPFLVKSDNLVKFKSKKHRQGGNTYGAAGDARSLSKNEINAMYGKSTG